tara:strand:+ start:207 stop:314 length:108 start_codon:yes stop_codon:yes gene_type:complete
MVTGIGGMELLLMVLYMRVALYKLDFLILLMSMEI